MPNLPLSDHAIAQQRLWGTDPAGWADYAEPHTRPLFEAMLDSTRVSSGTRLLDVGCGSGLAMLMAVERGAAVSGIDVSPGLLGVAQRRLPHTDLRLGDLQFLPYEDATFDVLIGVNSFQFAQNPVDALAEAARVTRPGGLVAASLFAEPDRNESTAVHNAMSGLSPRERQVEHEPYSLSGPGNLETAMRSAGLVEHISNEVPVDWAYASADDAVRGLLSSGGGARAIQDSGHAAVEAVVRQSLAPFTRPDGRVVMRNLFRYVVCSRPL